MVQVVFFCKKCDYVSPSFEREDDLGFAKCLGLIKNHLRFKHPRVRNLLINYDWRNLEESRQ